MEGEGGRVGGCALCSTCSTGRVPFAAIIFYVVIFIFIFLFSPTIRILHRLAIVSLVFFLGLSSNHFTVVSVSGKYIF
jgi:hypothetical protein